MISRLRYLGKGSAESLHASLSSCSIAGKRLSAKVYLEQWGSKLFPGYFGTFLHPFFTALLPMDADERVAAVLAAYPQLLLAMQLPQASTAAASPGEWWHAGSTSWKACPGHWPYAVPAEWALRQVICIFIKSLSVSGVHAASVVMHQMACRQGRGCQRRRTEQ